MIRVGSDSCASATEPPAVGFEAIGFAVDRLLDRSASLVCDSARMVDSVLGEAVDDVNMDLPVSDGGAIGKILIRLDALETRLTIAGNYLECLEKGMGVR